MLADPLYAKGPPAYGVPTMNAGQRPAVIIRGNIPGPQQGIDTVYLLHFDRIIISGGGFQVRVAPSASRTCRGSSLTQR